MVLLDVRLLRSFSRVGMGAGLCFVLLPHMTACEQGAPAGTLPIESKTAALTANPAKSLNLSDAPGAALGRYRAFWPQRSDQDLADRLTKTVSLFRAAPPKLLTVANIRDQPSAPFDDPNILVIYQSKADDLRIEDPTRRPDAAPTHDIGETAAYNAMIDVFKSLVTKGLVQAEHYDTADFGTGHMKAGEYAGAGSPVREYVVEYRFRLLRKLNGIDVANNGIVVGINPQGALSSLRLGGAQFDSAYDGVEEKPSAKGEIVARKVATDAIADRFNKEIYPRSRKHIVYARKMYVLPATVQEAIVEPLFVYRFAAIQDTPEGPVPSSAKVYGFSLTDNTKAPLDLYPE